MTPIESLSAQIKSSCTGSNCEVQLPFVITDAGLTVIRTKRNDICYYDLNTGKVSLVLTNEQGHTREIGQIRPLREEFNIDISLSSVMHYTKPVKKNHLLITKNAYGINSIVVNHLLTEFDFVSVTKRSRKYIIPRKTLKEKGEYLDFGLRTAGTEPQLFYDINFWDEYK